jgi:hypothetical protein
MVLVFKYKDKCNVAIFEVFSNLLCTYKIILFLIKWIINRILERSFRKDLLGGTGVVVMAMEYKTERR